MTRAQYYAQALMEALEETSPKDQDAVLNNFVKILKQSGELKFYPQIEAAYLELERKKKGIQEMEITAAHAGVANKQIIEELNRIAGSKTEVTEKLDENLIGGVVVRIGETLIDGSVRSSLDRLRQEIIDH